MKPEQAVRDRTLSDDELVRVWRTADKSDGVFAALIQFLLLSCARLNEAASMTWDEVRDGVWVLPKERSKTGVEIVRPLSKAALAVISDRTYSPPLGSSRFAISPTPSGSLTQHAA